MRLAAHRVVLTLTGLLLVLQNGLVVYNLEPTAVLLVLEIMLGHSVILNLDTM